MSTDSKQASEVIMGIVKEMKLKQEVTGIVYRADYEDFQVLFGDTHHCEIQEKSINDLLKFKSGDAKRQIQFQLNHLIVWEDGENQGEAPEPEDKMPIDKE